MEQYLRPINQKQAVNVLGFIEATQDEAVKRDIFGQLGTECFRLGHSKELEIDANDNIEKIMNLVNIEKKHPSWEKLEFNENKTILYLTGKPVEGKPYCPCSFGRGENPPKSLCFYCCKAFQEQLWSMVFKRKVTVEIPQSKIFGDNRCNHVIHLL